MSTFGTLLLYFCVKNSEEVFFIFSKSDLVVDSILEVEPTSVSRPTLLIHLLRPSMGWLLRYFESIVLEYSVV